MKSVLISIRPKWCELIASGKKTVEVRKTKPKLKTPFKCYIYCTKEKWLHLTLMPDKTYRIYDGHYWGKYDKLLDFSPEGNGSIIGEFVCDEIETYIADDFVGAEEIGSSKIREKPVEGEYGYWIPHEERTCLDYNSIHRYGGGKTLYGWHISDLKIYDKPKELGGFCTVDEKEVQSCICREQVGQPEYKTQHCGWIKGGFVCNDTDDWCTKCKRKPITRPPQSWMFVEELQ